MLRWSLQHGGSVISKSTKPHRIAENIDVFDFELSANEVATIDRLDTGRRGGLEQDQSSELAACPARAEPFGDPADPGRGLH